MMKWYLLRSQDEDFIKQVALAKGWREKEVQVRRALEYGEYWFYIEPFEEDCNCPNLLKPPDLGPALVSK